MNKSFEWKVVFHPELDKIRGKTLSLLEIKDDGESRIFWASINLSVKDGGYEFVAFPKSRHNLMSPGCCVETLDIAKNAIVEFLAIEQVIVDGDCVYEP